MPTPRVQIRPLTTHEDFRASDRIQKAVWGNAGVSSEVLQVTQKYGGVVLGALVNGKVVGCLYAFLARRHGRLIHWSHIMAVEPGYRNLGLGFQMKLMHRELALAQGIKSICWTFDPLQSRNATLNLARLGARVEEYVVDCYGRFPSRIERGLPSDRFVVNWRIASAAVARRLKEGPPTHALLAFPQANQTRTNRRGWLEIANINLRLRSPRLLVEIPSNPDAMRARALKLARRWRLQVRRIIQHYFAAGYRVVDFFPPQPANEGRCFYLLRRQCGVSEIRSITARTQRR